MGNAAATAAQSPQTGTVADAQAATRLRLAVGRLSRQLRRNQVGGLSASQLSALFSIDHHGPIRLTDLAEREQISPPALSACVASLEKRQLAQREQDPADRRTALMVTTAQGRSVLAQIRRENTAELTQRISELDDTARRALTEALPVLEQLTADDQ